ncbi:radical SAM protein [Ruminiclostridium josui]|uniref:radical SAM protein n=1 Tax=Ruminiclostridium josui TaxID=1499 RepID=UPI0006D27449|nr:radical SAM protein [Ruminiclostridium josui]
MTENISGQIPLYKQSYYNFELKLDNEKYMLYNTKTGAVSLLDNIERDTMSSALSGKNVCKDRLLIGNLLSQGFIVERNRNELDDIKSITQSFRKAKNLVRLIVLPAEACNFTCPYCFIYRQRNIFMSEWVYDSILKYIESKVSKSTEQTLVQLSWYGGEPLLASQKIIEFMGRLNQLKENYNFKLNSSIYTNGYLLTSDLFQQLLECGIETFQVTVDGGKSSHDRLRRLNSGESTFDTIYTNLKNIKRFTGKEEKF